MGLGEGFKGEAARVLPKREDEGLEDLGAVVSEEWVLWFGPRAIKMGEWHWVVDHLSI